MKKLYVWNPNKRGRKNGRQHIWIDGNPVCRMSVRVKATMKAMSETPAKNRKVCGSCLAGVVGTAQKPKAQKRTGQKSFYQTQEWKRVRYQALKMADGRCTCCGVSATDGAKLNVDHIKPRYKHPELALTLSNLQVLCGSCNQGKGGWDETDWREPRLATLMGERIE